MIKSILWASILILLITSGCKKDNPTEPQQVKPAGYQEEVVWPSLGNNAWPMRHADAQSTGRSSSNGPLHGRLLWSFNSMEFNSTDLKTEPVVANDSIIFIAFKDSLLSFNLEGKIISRRKIGYDNVITPILTSGDRIYLCYDNLPLECYKLKGVKIWSSTTALYSQINIDREGNIYGINETAGGLICIDKNGAVAWKFFDTDIKNGSRLAFSPDGKYLYITGSTNTLLSFDINTKSIRWKTGNTYNLGAPLVDYEGNIYITTGIDSINSSKVGLYCLRPDGSVKWFYPHSEYTFSDISPWNRMNFHGEPTMDKNGNIYFGSDTLHSLTYDGKLRWKQKLQISPAASLVCDARNNIYAVKDVASDEFSVISINSSGIINWSVNNLKGESTSFSPVIAFDKLIIPTQDHFIYVVE